MKLGNISVALCVTAAATAVSSHAGEHSKESRDSRRHDTQMQIIHTSAKVGEPGHGWQYFSDPRTSRAVVISPNGDYYYSHGAGLQLVFKGSGAA